MMETLISRIASWQWQHKERQVDRLTRQATVLISGREVSLLQLHKHNFVRIAASGLSASAVKLAVDNSLRKSISLVIEPGTCFVARGNWQHMVCRQAYRFTLEPYAAVSLTVPAVGMNAGRSFAAFNQRFRGVKQAPADVARFLAATSAEDDLTVQAGVWALIDNYSADELRAIGSLQRTLGAMRPIRAEHIQAAGRVLDELGIEHALQ